MSGPIHRKPIEDLEKWLGTVLVQVAPDAELTHRFLSVCEFLKDAKRWGYVAENTVQWNNHEPRTAADFRKLIDEEIENERQRLVRTRQGRRDGVSGDQGGGGAADPVV